MKDKKIVYVIAGFIIFFGLISVYNWFPRPGWPTVTATYRSGSGEVEYYAGQVHTIGRLSGGGDAHEPNRRQKTIKVQYNPEKPYIVRAAPSSRQFLFSALLFGAGFGLLYYVKKH